MIYKLKRYDYPDKTWKPSNTFKSTVSRLKTKGYLLNRTGFYYPFVPRGVPVAPSCLANWMD